METKKPIQEEFREDTLKTMDSAYEELRLILIQVMHNKLKRSEAVRFVEKGELKKAFQKIKVIVESYHFLRSVL